MCPGFVPPSHGICWDALTGRQFLHNSLGDTIPINIFHPCVAIIELATLLLVAFVIKVGSVGSPCYRPVLVTSAEVKDIRASMEGMSWSVGWSSSDQFPTCSVHLLVDDFGVIQLLFFYNTS